MPLINAPEAVQEGTGRGEGGRALLVEGSSDAYSSEGSQRKASGTEMNFSQFYGRTGILVKFRVIRNELMCEKKLKDACSLEEKLW